jgi:hypothetical protein
MKILKTAYRRYVSPESYQSTIRFYEALQAIKCERRLSFADLGIDVAVVGSFIILSGDNEALAPVRHVEAALIVDSLEGFASLLRESGIDVPDEFHCTPAGKNFTVRHADGLVVEYFEPRPT